MNSPRLDRAPFGSDKRTEYACGRRPQGHPAFLFRPPAPFRSMIPWSRFTAVEWQPGGPLDDP